MDSTIVLTEWLERSKEEMFSRCLILILLAPAVLAQSTGCDISHILKPGVTHLKSPNYPGNYSAGSSCKYKYTAPPNYYVRVNCTLRLPSNNDKNKDKFFLASEGDRRTPRPRNFYGYRSLSPRSFYRNLVLGYVSNGMRGGNFRCLLRTSKQNCECGRSTPSARIFNGVEVLGGTFPSMVVLIDREPAWKPLCSGTIVTSKHVLTARTCLSVVSRPSALIVTTYIDTSGSHFGHSIKRRLGDDKFDIAILEIVDTIHWNDYISPACLPPLNAPQTFTNEIVDLAGFNKENNRIQTISHQVVDDSFCSRNWTHLINRPMCTFDFQGNTRHTCEFDKGGPVYLRKSKMFLIGILWSTNNCEKNSNHMSQSINIMSELYHILFRINYTNCVVNFE